LNLVVSADVAKADIGSPKKLSVQMFSKLTALWNKQTRSSLAADKVRESHGKLLPTPSDTRYTHTFSGPFSRNYPGKPIAARQNQTGFWKQERVSVSGISRAICKSAPNARQVTTSAPHRSVFFMPDALPAAQPTALKH